MKFKHPLPVFLLITLTTWVLIISGCSTKRNTAVSRAYHNLTSHYNVYWNGMSNMQEGVAYLKKNRTDNYKHILSLFNYGDKKLANQLKPKMERTLKKASVGIQHHSMVFNGKEQIRWVTESYLMMGQAHFYKHDYVSAARVFDFVAKKYNTLPIHYRGILWIAKTAIETKDFAKAEASLNLLSSQETSDGFPLVVAHELPLVQADFYLKKNNPAAAYPFLEQSLRVCRDKDLRSRILFIMGQINQKNGDLKAAGDFYQKVIKRNPPFQMAFEARLNMATSFDTANGNSKSIVNILEKMAKKNQYQEYLGQIYFALAEVAQKNHQDSLEIQYLKLSVSNSKKNDYQKSSSSLKLADCLFNTGKYSSAGAYYDTAVRFLPKNYPNYEQIKKKANILSQMLTYLQTVHLQDSLQQMAKLDTTSLYALVDKKIDTYQKAVANKKEESEIANANADNSSFSGQGKPTAGFRPGNGYWYFYNTAAKSKGYSEFLSRWGRRKLEDMWFLSEKQIVGGSVGESNDKNTPLNGKNKIGLPPLKDPANRAYYLKDLPKTTQDFQLSDSLITEAYHKLGSVYLEELHDTTHALDIYSRADSRYPNNPYQLENWYHLYKIYSGLEKDSLANIYKQKLLLKYPNSLYTRVISDPDFNKKLNLKHLEAEKTYHRAYEAFQNEQYYRVITYAKRAVAQYPDDTLLLPKFMYLQALSIGKVEIPDSLYSSLQQLVKKYPHHPITPQAIAIIKMLQKEYGIGISERERRALLAGKEKKKGIGPYIFEQNSPQYVLVLTNRKTVQARALTTRLSDFNHKFTQGIPLSIKNMALDNSFQLILVGKFDLAKAWIYYTALQKDQYVFSGIKKKNYHLFIISEKNYPLFYRDKNQKIYQEFFNKFYHQPNQN